MFIHPDFNPVAISIGPYFGIGPLSVRWYGLMYLLAFTLVFVLGRWRIKRGNTVFTNQALDDVLFFGMLGTILGGRIGYILFYQFAKYQASPLDIFKVWEGGMSFHGGLIGVILGMAWFARSRGLRFFQVADFIAPLVPLGLAAGRFGNFINGELWGRPTNVPWAMIFPHSTLPLVPRHPSQLYEIGLEGFLLFAILWWFSRKPRPVGAVSALFLVGYGLARFVVEFTREPDENLGLLQLGLSMGQWLSIPMVLAGAVLFALVYRRANRLPDAVVRT